MARIKSKQNSTFVGKAVVAVKGTDKNVYSKRQGKNIDITEFSGKFNSSDGTFFTIRVTKTSDEKYKETGIGYWVEIAEFGKSNKHSQR